MAVPGALPGQISGEAIMKLAPARSVLLALLCASALAASAGAAQAGEHGRRGKGWGHASHASHGHPAHKHHHRQREKRTVHRERVVVHEVPRRYRAPAPVIHHHHDVYAPLRSLAHRGAPAMVIGVDIAPVVIPLR